VHRIGPRLLAPQKPSISASDEQLGHLITPEIYRAFALYGDKSFSGIAKDKLIEAVTHAAPGMTLGTPFMREIEK
jgi:hypothetical protein